jgi:hypothetical protein
MKLAKLKIPPGESCIGSKRIEELGRPDAQWQPHEAEHLTTCNWCRYLWTNGEDRCIPMTRMLALSLHAEPTKEERQHLAECPACSWEYQELCQPDGAGKGRSRSEAVEIASV